MPEQTFGRHPNVKLFRGLIGTESKPAASLFLCKIPEGNSVFRRMSEAWAPGESREIQVEMITLPALLRLLGATRIDLLKVDIEGSEWDLLEALSTDLARRIDQVSVEFHDFLDPSQRSRTERCIAHLEKLGYVSVCRGTDHVHGSPYYDCLFYAERSP
jgi:FkbM family methyltransferase